VKKKGAWVYIMCSMNNTTLYVGATSMPGARIAQHKEKFYPDSSTSKYNCKKLSITDGLIQLLQLMKKRELKAQTVKRKRCSSIV